jgi:hypothetical protein
VALHLLHQFLLPHGQLLLRDHLLPVVAAGGGALLLPAFVELGGEDAFGEDEGAQAVLGEGVEVVVEAGVVVGVRLLEDGGVSALAEEQHLVGPGSVLHQHAHALAGREGQHLHQLIHHLLLLEMQLDEVLRLLDEAVADVVSEVDEADLVRTTPLELVLELVLHNVVAH